MCAHFEKSRMLAHLAEKYPAETKQALEVRSHAGLTPLTTAVHLNKPALFDQFLRLQAVEMWRYGPVISRRHPLKELDSLFYRQETRAAEEEANSVLEIIADTGNVDLLHPIVKELIRDKWSSYGRSFYMIWIGVYLVDQIVLAMVNASSAFPRHGILVMALVMAIFANFNCDY